MYCRLLQEVLHNQINWLCCIRKSWLSSASHLTPNKPTPTPTPMHSPTPTVFSVNLLATGYGNIAPRTEGGKIFCILYAIFGIPLFGFLLAGIGDQLGTIFVKSILRVEKIFRVSLFGISHLFSSILHFNPQLRCFIVAVIPFLYLNQQKHRQISQTKIRVTSTILFILAGCIVFVTIPAVIFKHIEGWTALEAIYFVVITLTTVGIGDYVAGAVFLQRNPILLSSVSDWMKALLHFQGEIGGSSTWTGTSLWCGSGSWWVWRTLQPSSAWLETGFECCLKRPKRRWASFNYTARY